MNIPGDKEADSDMVYQLLCEYNHLRLDLLGHWHRATDKSHWTREHYIARLVLIWENGYARERCDQSSGFACRMFAAVEFWEALCSLHAMLWYKRCNNIKAEALATEVAQAEKSAD